MKKKRAPTNKETEENKWHQFPKGALAKGHMELWRLNIKSQTILCLLLELANRSA